jgi:hypothetical protein
MIRLACIFAFMIILGSGATWTVVRASESAELGGRRPSPTCLEAPLSAAEDSTIHGTARLCVDGLGVRAAITAKGLAPGDAYTVWFIYFDQPRACTASPCAVPDVVGDDPPGVLARMDGLIAGGAGEAKFSGLFRGLRLSAGAEIHLPIVGHGPAGASDNRVLARQLLPPQVSVLGAPGPGAAADGDVGHPVAVAIFTIPDDGR